MDGLKTPRLEPTFELLERVKAGDGAAVALLVGRCLPALHRWSRARFSSRAHTRVDIDDVVQETLLAAVTFIDLFEQSQSCAFLAYLRQAIIERVRDETARAAPCSVPENPSDRTDVGVCRVEAAMGREMAEHYEAALARLRPQDREAIVARVEMGCSYEEVAAALGERTTDAARLAVTRALMRLAQEISRLP